MAAARGATSSSSSEEEEEGLKRLREAAWDPVLQRAATAGAALLAPTGGNFKKSKLPSVEPSIREKAIDHRQDGNELQTTPEFRAHVAKKLGAILDSSITVLKNPPRPAQNDVKSLETEDDGFRLFSSSVPGDCGKPEPLPSGKRRRQCCSSSSSSELDSDQEWQRCQDAAVTAEEILKLSGLPIAALQDPSQNHRCPASEPSQKKRRRKRRRKAKAEGEDGDEKEAIEGAHRSQASGGTEGPLCLNGVCRRGENVSAEDMVVKKKKKMKEVEARTE
ncbi:protein CUSTOS [Rhineura floridana]|uniref:protein CUSTOS n=1 Tax=Rhineura floridana TaxID=261503 RepID=UPI002AC88CD9|nr:protein CUSTOS [Rhineura floridana]